VASSRTIVQRRASDVRLFGVAGYALTLQVAHPTIAAGVRDHSGFATDPWGRFFRTTDYLTLLIYGSPETTRSVSKRLRAMHAAIRGTAPDGVRYDALEPSAYAWVHGTLAEAIVRGHDLFGTPLTASQREDFWGEWRSLGGVLGIAGTDMPPTWTAFQDHLSYMTEEVLEDNDVIHAVLRTADRAVGGSPWGWLDDRLWALAGVPLAHYGRFLSIGTTPEALRRRLGLPWSAVEDAAFSVVAAAHRATTPALPRHLRCAGPMVLQLRRREIGRGPFGARHGQMLVSSGGVSVGSGS
jgi:uncharacterized protein (DUF2236 family)